MVSQAYEDTVGVLDRDVWPASYNTSISTVCPRCGAHMFRMCTNPTTGRFSKVPCRARLALS